MHSRNLVCTLLISIVAGVTPGHAIAAGTLFRDVRVFDGQDVVPQTNVLVVDGVIAGIGNVAAPADAVIVDGRGKTLLPGLIDSHVHSYLPSVQQEALRFGVTTQLDMFTNHGLLAGFKSGRESLAATDLADVFSAGTLVTAPRGHGTQFGMQIPTLTPEADAAAFVKARVAEGSDFIKIVMEDGTAFSGQLRFQSLNGATAAAVIKAAHAADKLAVVHVSSESAALSVLQSGADGLAHSFFDRVAGDEFVKLARDNKSFVVATLSVNATAAGSSVGPSLLNDAHLKPYVLPNQKAPLAATFPGMRPVANALTNSSESVRKLHAAGVTVLAGTDAGNPGTAHGVSLHGELELLVQAGMKPIEALRAATSAPARAFRLADRGVVASGKRADLLLVEGDPTVDVLATRRIVGVWKNGQPLKREVTPPQPVAPKAPEGFPISDFEAGSASARFGMWQITTDAMRGGKSTGAMNIVEGGGENSAKALRVAGTVAPGASPWSGIIFVPGRAPYTPVDFSGRKAVSFWMKGDGRAYQVMLFTGSMQSPPSARVVQSTKDVWQQHRVPLDQFAGADASQLIAVAIVASAPAGPFETIVDSFGID